jgi:predicted short-subunit dehydrogenase-like oxidoreductase (DUF2520 family)
MDVAVVGAGRVGTAVGVLLRDAGHRIVAVSGREGTARRSAAYLPGVAVRDPADAAAEADLVVLGVPDDELEATATVLARAGAFRAGAWVIHLSGAAGLDVLAPVRAAGARPLALHPLQTFPDVEAALERIPGCAVGVTAEDDEGDALGARIAEDLGARPFRLPEKARPLYHAAAVFASNYVVASIGRAEQLLGVAGIGEAADALVTLVRATVDNVDRLGTGAALTGPAVRGDAGTVARNLDALAESAPDAVAAYVAMAREALRLATDAGRLAPEARARVEEVLTHWT